MFIQSFGMTYPVLRDVTRDVYLTYNIMGISPFPRDVIIDPEGVIRYLNSEYDPQFMIEVLQDITITAVREDPALRNIPQSLQLQIYPNPSNSQTIIEFRVPDLKENILQVFDITGRRIFSRSLGKRPVGETVRFNFDHDGLASGMYLVVVKNGNFREVQRMMIIH